MASEYSPRAMSSCPRLFNTTKFIRIALQMFTVEGDGFFRPLLTGQQAGHGHHGLKLARPQLHAHQIRGLGEVQVAPLRIRVP